VVQLLTPTAVSHTKRNPIHPWREARTTVVILATRETPATLGIQLVAGVEVAEIMAKVVEAETIIEIETEEEVVVVDDTTTTPTTVVAVVEVGTTTIEITTTTTIETIKEDGVVEEEVILAVARKTDV